MKNSLKLSLFSLLSMSVAAFAHDSANIIAKIAAIQPPLDPKTTAVVIVDIQKDFTQAHNGSLAVPNSGNDYVETATAVTSDLKNQGFKIYNTQDFHPMNHMSFVTNNPESTVFTTVKKLIPTVDGHTIERDQVMWPAHCVQGTSGADTLIEGDVVVQKGTNPDCDSYSGFADDGGQETKLKDLLNADNTDTILVEGIATDYCVKFTVLDALARGFKVYVALDLCRGVAEESTQAAIAEMEAAGAHIIR